jgi:hypothetical protein
MVLILGSAAVASEQFPIVIVSDLPPTIAYQWHEYKPNLGSIGRCATAFDRGDGPEKEVFTCSIYVKISAVAERRSMARCEEMRLSKGIRGPCRLIKD